MSEQKEWTGAISLGGEQICEGDLLDFYPSNSAKCGHNKALGRGEVHWCEFDLAWRLRITVQPQGWDTVSIRLGGQSFDYAHANPDVLCERHDYDDR